MIDLEVVNEVFMDCLHRPEEVPNAQIPADAVVVEGILNTFAFHRERLESHRAEVQAWLALLPIAFRKNGGGGWSFLNACNQEGGEQWTGLHRRMDQLFTLAIGLGLAKWLMPRDMWDALPGGMPYV